MHLWFDVWGDGPSEIEDKARAALDKFDNADNWAWEINATAIQFMTGAIAHWEGRVHAWPKMPADIENGHGDILFRRDRQGGDDG